MNIDFFYIFLYSILLYFAFSYQKTKSKSYIVWSIAVSFVFIAFRAPTVGADTIDYVKYLTGECNYYNDDERELESLFVVYRECLSFITSSRFLVMLINTIVSVTPLYLILKKESSSIPFSILLFFFLGGPVLYFIGFRQVLGLAVVWLGYYYFEYGKSRSLVKKWIILLGAVVIGYFLHTSVIIHSLLLIVVILSPQINRVVALSLVISTFVIGVVLSSFSVFSAFQLYFSLDIDLLARLNNYAYMDEISTQVPLFLIVLNIVIILCIILLQHKLNNHFFKLFILGVSIYNLFYVLPMIPRIVSPLLITGAFFIPSLLEKESPNYSSKFKWCFYLIFLLLAFRSCKESLNYDRNDLSRLHPYMFIFQDY